MRTEFGFPYLFALMSPVLRLFVWGGVCALAVGHDVLFWFSLVVERLRGHVLLAGSDLLYFVRLDGWFFPSALWLRPGSCLSPGMQLRHKSSRSRCGLATGKTVEPIPEGLRIGSDAVVALRAPDLLVLLAIRGGRVWCQDLFVGFARGTCVS